MKRFGIFNQRPDNAPDALIGAATDEFKTTLRETYMGNHLPPDPHRHAARLAILRSMEASGVVAISSADRYEVNRMADVLPEQNNAHLAHLRDRASNSAQ